MPRNHNPTPITIPRETHTFYRCLLGTMGIPVFKSLSAYDYTELYFADSDFNNASTIIEIAKQRRIVPQAETQCLANQNLNP